MLSNGVGKSTIFNLITGLISLKRFGFYRCEKVNNSNISAHYKIQKCSTIWGYFYDLTLFENLKQQKFIKDPKTELKK